MDCIKFANPFGKNLLHSLYMSDTHFNRGVRVSLKSRGSKLRLFMDSNGQTLGPRNFSGFFPILLRNRPKYIWKMYAEKGNGNVQELHSRRGFDGSYIDGNNFSRDIGPFYI